MSFIPSFSGAARRSALVLVLTSMIVAGGAVASAHAATRRGPSSYPTIAWGISVAVGGDTVLVAPGVYHEELTLPSGVTLLSEGGAVVTTITATSPLAIRSSRKNPFSARPILTARPPRTSKDRTER